jgi:hypothetical protein
LEYELDPDIIKQYEVYGEIVEDGYVSDGEVKAYQSCVEESFFIGTYYSDLMIDEKPGCLEDCRCSIINAKGRIRRNSDVRFTLDLTLKYRHVKESENEHSIKITNCGNETNWCRIKIPESYNIDYVKGARDYEFEDQTISLNINPNNHVIIQISKEDQEDEMIIVYSLLAFFLIGVALVIFTVIRVRKMGDRKKVIGYDQAKSSPCQIVQNNYNTHDYQNELPLIGPPPDLQPISPNQQQPQTEVTKSFGCSNCNKPFKAIVKNETYKVACPSCGSCNVILPLSLYE